MAAIRHYEHRFTLLTQMTQYASVIVESGERELAAHNCVYMRNSVQDCLYSQDQRQPRDDLDQFLPQSVPRVSLKGLTTVDYDGSMDTTVQKGLEAVYRIQQPSDQGWLGLLIFPLVALKAVRLRGKENSWENVPAFVQTSQ